MDHREKHQRASSLHHSSSFVWESALVEQGLQTNLHTKNDSLWNEKETGDYFDVTDTTATHHHHHRNYHHNHAVNRDEGDLTTEAPSHHCEVVSLQEEEEEDPFCNAPIVDVDKDEEEGEKGVFFWKADEEQELQSTSDEGPYPSGGRGSAHLAQWNAYDAARFTNAIGGALNRTSSSSGIKRSSVFEDVRCDCIFMDSIAALQYFHCEVDLPSASREFERDVLLHDRKQFRERALALARSPSPAEFLSASLPRQDVFLDEYDDDETEATEHLSLLMSERATSLLQLHLSKPPSGFYVCPWQEVLSGPPIFVSRFVDHSQRSTFLGGHGEQAATRRVRQYQRPVASTRAPPNEESDLQKRMKTALPLYTAAFLKGLPPTHQHNKEFHWAGFLNVFNSWEPQVGSLNRSEQFCFFGTSVTSSLLGALRRVGDVGRHPVNLLHALLDHLHEHQRATYTATTLEGSRPIASEACENEPQTVAFSEAFLGSPRILETGCRRRNEVGDAMNALPDVEESAISGVLLFLPAVLAQNAAAYALRVAPPEPATRGTKSGARTVSRDETEMNWNRAGNSSSLLHSISNLTPATSNASSASHDRRNIFLPIRAISAPPQHSESHRTTTHRSDHHDHYANNKGNLPRGGKQNAHQKRSHRPSNDTLDIFQELRRGRGEQHPTSEARQGDDEDMIVTDWSGNVLSSAAGWHNHPRNGEPQVSEPPCRSSGQGDPPPRTPPLPPFYATCGDDGTEEEVVFVGEIVPLLTVEAAPKASHNTKLPSFGASLKHLQSGSKDSAWGSSSQDSLSVWCSDISLWRRQTSHDSNKAEQDEIVWLGNHKPNDELSVGGRTPDENEEDKRRSTMLQLRCHVAVPNSSRRARSIPLRRGTSKHDGRLIATAEESTNFFRVTFIVPASFVFLCSSAMPLSTASATTSLTTSMNQSATKNGVGDHAAKRQKIGRMLFGSGGGGGGGAAGGLFSTTPDQNGSAVRDPSTTVFQSASVQLDMERATQLRSTAFQGTARRTAGGPRGAASRVDSSQAMGVGMQVASTTASQKTSAAFAAPTTTKTTTALGTPNDPATQAEKVSLELEELETIRALQKMARERGLPVGSPPGVHFPEDPFLRRGRRHNNRALQGDRGPSHFKAHSDSRGRNHPHGQERKRNRSTEGGDLDFNA